MGESYEQRIKRESEHRKKRLDEIHKEAEPWQKSGGYPVEFMTFDFLLTAGVFESKNEPTVDNCYVHRIKSIRDSWFKTITEKTFDFTPPF